LNAIPGQPAGRSRLCLSCHDGTVAVDAYQGDGAGGNTYYMTNPRALVGTDLRKHHPISFTYDAALAAADGELADPTTTASGLGNTIAKDLLFMNQLECPTCHDPHVSRNTQGCMGCHFSCGTIYCPTLSLRKSNAGSAFCLTCHKK
jgi:hypothetical protein